MAGGPNLSPLHLDKLPHFGHLSSRTVPTKIERMHVNMYTVEGRASKIDALETNTDAGLFLNLSGKILRSLTYHKTGFYKLSTCVISSQVS